MRKIEIRYSQPDSYRDDSRLSRRSFFERMSGGIYGAALTYLFGKDLGGASELMAAGNEESVPADLQPRRPPFQPRAKPAIHLSLPRAPSQTALFVPKPALGQRHRAPSSRTSPAA